MPGFGRTIKLRVPGEIIFATPPLSAEITDGSGAAAVPLPPRQEKELRQRPYQQESDY